jgi:hypothetical protein
MPVAYQVGTTSEFPAWGPLVIDLAGSDVSASSARGLTKATLSRA